MFLAAIVAQHLVFSNLIVAQQWVPSIYSCVDQQWLPNFTVSGPGLTRVGFASASEVWTSAILKWLKLWD
jgi:hypothetical protein